MKKHLCFILLLFVGELSWAQISNDKPKGQVVMITTKAYDEIYNFGEVSELKLRDEETVSYFDKRGNIIHERQIDYKGRIETAYLYTDEGKIIKEITTTPKATESAVVYDTLKLKLYTYDDSGRVKTESVFENKSLTSIEIPASVEMIDMYYCINLANIYCYPSIPPILNDFRGKNFVLYVPSQSLEAYKNSSWSEYYSSIKTIQ